MSDERNARVIFAIRQFVKQKGYAPTVRELSAMLELPSSSVQRSLLSLAQSGSIAKTKGIARSVVLKEEAR